MITSVISQSFKRHEKPSVSKDRSLRSLRETFGFDVLLMSRLCIFTEKLNTSSQFENVLKLIGVILGKDINGNYFIKYNNEIYIKEKDNVKLLPGVLYYPVYDRQSDKIESIRS